MCYRAETSAVCEFWSQIVVAWTRGGGGSVGIMCQRNSSGVLGEATEGGFGASPKKI